MTNAELIATIQAKIEKLIERYGSVKAKGILQNGYKGGRLIGYEDALNILKRIQEDLEKPMPAKVAGKGLEVEAVSYIFDNGLNISPKVAIDFARHFYELGCHRTAEKYDEIEYNRQRAEEQPVGLVAIKPILPAAPKPCIATFKEQGGSSEIPKDLAIAAESFAFRSLDEVVLYGCTLSGRRACFIAGAKWDREQIMKNAKDGWMDEEDVIILNDGTRIDLQPDYDKKPAFEFKYAQDVRVIVLPKEDSHDTRRKE